jgi:hypothetical protein
MHYIYVHTLCIHVHTHVDYKDFLNVFSVDLLTPNFAETGRVDSEMKRAVRHTMCNKRVQAALHSQYIKLCFMPAAVRSGRNCERL